MIKFKTIIICFVVFYVLCFNLNLSVFATSSNKMSVSVSANAAALYCVNTGEFLFTKNAETTLPMASTTKVMTSLLALENASTNNKTVTITPEMYAEGSSMYLKEGDKLHLSDLAVGMMTVSGNDAANAVALTISESFEDFAKVMNDKAKVIGMDNTNFVTASGLDDENHYSTAKDMALLMSYAMENEDFANITSQKSIKVDFIYPEDTSNTYSNHNKLLSLYEYCNGGKTGYTSTAGRCLVSSANKDGMELIAVTLNASDDWDDHINMYEKGFEQLTSTTFDDDNFNLDVNVVGGVDDTINIGASTAMDIVTLKEDKNNIEREINIPMFLYAPIEKGEIVGEITYKVNDKVVETNELIAHENIKYSEKEKNIFEKILEFFKFK